MRFPVAGVLCIFACAAATTACAKEAGVFYPASLVERAKANIAKYPWAAEQQKLIVEAAAPWMKMSDDELWELMFGNTIKRSWMVWSNGHCPACKKGVPMYAWEIDALGQPWKVRCPQCKEFFPKNDFGKFYRSGLDEHGVFDTKLADRSLLFNAEHPDPDDPLHGFGVDDGEGYVEGDKRWRFIGAYLIYGQWKQAVLSGIRNLAAAYVVTGDGAYAHKAGVLLDRVADLYPTFDFAAEGLVYETSGSAGYVSVWHDACEETRELALAYDQVFDALREDAALVAFLSAKAKAFKLDNPKSGFEDIRRNIEERILLDALANRPKMHSNYPRTPIAVAIIKMILGWPGNRQEVCADLDETLARSTAVDGVTGEKGLAGYTAYTISGLAVLLAQCAGLDPDFLRDLLQRHPGIHQMYRFHIDTWCFQKYYPNVGDAGSFASKYERYAGVGFTKNPGLYPSMFTFFRQLYELTGDAAFAQVLYHANGNSVDGLPYDLFAEDPEAFQRSVRGVIAAEGTIPKVGNVNKEQWHLAILRSGEDADARALWLEYDAFGGHGHANGMNLGLFAKGLDLMPDFGYKPVNFGGWGAPRAVWYGMSAAHNTVVVDGQDHKSEAGRTTLWADGEQFRAIRASGLDLIGGKQFERTSALIDVSHRDFYILDVFRVGGGTDHAKFMHSHFGTIATQGLTLTPGEDYGHGTQMRNFLCDASPQPGWSVDWQIEDRYKYLPPGSEVHLRYTDLTAGAQASTAETWVSVGSLNATGEAWIPTVMVRRQSENAPLASTFVAVIEPYEKQSGIRRIRRLPLETRDGTPYPDPNVAIEVQLTDGRCDLLIAPDVENPLGLTPSKAGRGILAQKDWNLRTDAELCLVRRSSSGEIERIAVCRGSFARVGDVMLRLKKPTDFVEVQLAGGQASIVAGEGEIADG